MSKGEETRQRIVAEAAPIFNRHGFEGASMAELMQATGLEKGGIYRHFTSKEELALEAFDYALNLATQARTEGVDQVSNSVDKLKKFIANFVQRVPAVPGGCPLLNTAVDSDDGNELLRDRAHKALRNWKKYLGAIVRKGISAGEIRRDVDPNKVGILIVSGLEGALMMSRLEGNRAPLQTVQAFLEHHLDHQVRAVRK